MMNELLFILTMLLNFVGIIISYKVFKKTGLYIWIAFATILANIEVIKMVDIFGLSVTLGNVIYGTVFLATDILSENYGKKDAQKGVYIGFFTLIVFTILSQVNLLYVPNANDFSHSAMELIFGFMPRICIASMITYILSNLLDTNLYQFIKKMLPDDKYLWVRNNGSTLVSQLFDSVLFTLLAFYGLVPAFIIPELIVTTYIIKFIIAICDTPFMYIAKKIYKGEKEVSNQLF